MSTHSPARHDDDNRRNDVPPGLAIPTPTQPDTQQSSTPPHNSHTRVLQVILHPSLSPSVLRKRIHTAPSRNENTIEELLTPPRPPQPHLPDQQHHRHDNPIPNKRPTHNKMRQTLSQMILPTKPHRRRRPKHKLHPRHHRHQTPQPPMHPPKNRPHPLMRRRAPSQKPPLSLLKMTPQIHAHAHLHRQHPHHPIRVARVYIPLHELSAAVHVTQEICYDRDDRAEDLHRDVQARVDETQDHACREDEAEGQDHEEDVCPEDAVDGVRGDDGSFGDVIVVAAVGGCEGREKGEGEEGERRGKRRGRKAWHGGRGRDKC